MTKDNKQLEKLIRETEAWCRPDHSGWEDLRKRISPSRPSSKIGIRLFIPMVTKLAAIVVLGTSLFYCAQLYGANVDLRNQLDAAINRIKSLLDELEIEKAIDEHGPGLIAAGRDRIGVNIRIDGRYVQKVLLTMEGEKPISAYEGPPTMPDEPNEPIPVHIRASSDPLILNGRVIKAELKFDFYTQIEDSNLVRQVPEDLRNQEREFLLTPEGIVADPRPIDSARDIKLHAIMGDGDKNNANRYIVTGRINGFRAGMYAFLAVDPITSDSIWITSALQPDANGDFVVRAFLGDGSRPMASLDRQIYQLFIILSPTADILKVGSQKPKPVDWSKLGCIVSPARLKRNDGSDGYADRLVSN